MCSKGGCLSTDLSRTGTGLSEMAEDMFETVLQLKSVDWESVWEVCSISLVFIEMNVSFPGPSSKISGVDCLRDA